MRLHDHVPASFQFPVRKEKHPVVLITITVAEPLTGPVLQVFETEDKAYVVVAVGATVMEAGDVLRL